MLNMTVTIHRNAVIVNGKQHIFRTHWVAGMLQALVQNGPSGLCRSALSNHLCLLGRREAGLNPKQAQRMMDTLQQALADMGGAEAMNRIRWAPGCKVNGPWFWMAKPTDRIEFHNIEGHTLDAAQGPGPLPSFHADPLSPQAIRIAHELKQWMAWMWEGDGDMLLSSHADETLWGDCSEPAKALRWMRLGEHAIAARSLDLAAASLDACELALRACDALTVGALAAVVQTLRWRLRYHANPVGNFAAVHQEALMAAQAPRSCEAVNVIAEINRLNLLMLCERRQLEQDPGVSGSDLHKAALLMVQHGHAALYLAVAASWMDRAQNVVANLAYAHQAVAKRFQLAGDSASEGLHLQLAVQWYAMALSYFTRFDVPENSAHEYIFLGELWQSSQRARDLFSEASPGMPWLQHRPDQPSYYQHASSVAKRIKDPKQIAYCGLMQWAFGQKTPHRDSMAEGLKTLQEVLAVHPDLVEVLSEEGYQLPTLSGTNASPATR